MSKFDWATDTDGGKIIIIQCNVVPVICVFIGAGERYNKMEMIVRYLTGRLRYCHCLPAPLRLAPNVSGRRQSRTEGCEREWWQGRMSQSDLSNSSPAPPPGYREGPHPVISGES